MERKKTDENPKQELRVVRLQVLSTKAQRIKQGACLDCGMVICPGARGRECLAERIDAEELKADKKELSEWLAEAHKMLSSEQEKTRGLMLPNPEKKRSWLDRLMGR